MHRVFLGGWPTAMRKNSVILLHMLSEPLYSQYISFFHEAKSPTVLLPPILLQFAILLICLGLSFLFFLLLSAFIKYFSLSPPASAIIK